MEKDIKCERIIIDTSIFTNPEVYQTFGTSPTGALRTFLEIIGKLEGPSFYMPPSIYQELLNFVEIKDIPSDLQIRILQEPPKRDELSVPAVLLYELIEDVRHRIDKGLRVAEEALREKINKGLKSAEEIERKHKTSHKKSVLIFPDVRMTEEAPYRTDSEALEAIAIADLRKKYRAALREGIIDSKEDVDLILLAKELDGILVTADTGIVKWADKLNIKSIEPHKLLDKDFMEKDIKDRRIIIDMSIFTYRESIGKLEGHSFYMPPSIYRELLNFVEIKEILPDLLIRILQKPPKRYELSVPAFLLYELIEDIRHRIDKGLRVAQEAVQKKINKGIKAAEEIERKRKTSYEKSIFLFPDVRMTEETPYRTDSEALDAIAIADLRKKYRAALREGIIDSKEDVDLILLAKELDGILVTADTGIVKWTDKLGIRYIDPRMLRDILDRLTKQVNRM